MRQRLARMAGLTAVAVFSLAAAGCGTSTDDSTASDDKGTTSGKVDAAQEIAEAATKTSKTTYKLTLTSGLVSGSGLADPTGKKSQLTIEVGTAGAEAAMEMRMVDKDLWMKIPGMPTGEGKWMHLNVADMPASFAAFGTADDPGSSFALMKAVKEVEDLGDGRYKGTLDLAKSPTSQALTKQLEQHSFGPELLIVPFETALDKEGRLVEISIDQSELIKAVAGDVGEGIAAATGKIEIKFSDFGVQVTDIVAPPASEVTEMPAELLKSFGG